MWKEGDILTRGGVTALLNSLDSIRASKYTDGELKDGMTVCFDESSDMSRSSFKRMYPNIKVVLDYKKADFLICRLNYVSPNWDCVWYIFRTHSTANNNDNQKVANASDVRIVNRMLRTKERFGGAKALISQYSIPMIMPNKREMTVEEREGIRKYLKADGKDMMELGLRMLLSFDLSMNRDSYGLCMLDCTYWRIPRTREFKDAMNKVRNEFPNLRR